MQLVRLALADLFVEAEPQRRLKRKRRKRQKEQ